MSGQRAHDLARRGEDVTLAARTVRIDAIHLPVAHDQDGLEEALAVVRRETRKTGVVAIHDNRYTDFVAAVCAAHLREHRGDAVEDSLERAMDAGLVVTSNAAALVEADPDWARGLPETPAGHPAYF